MKKIAISLGVFGMIFFSGCAQTNTAVTSQNSSASGGTQSSATAVNSAQNQAVTAETDELKTYTTASFSVDYPADFTAKEENIGVPVLVISNSKGKIQIGDFEPDASPGPQDGMTQEQIDGFPKDISYHGYAGKIASALFYKTGDDETMKALKNIRESVKLIDVVNYKNDMGLEVKDNVIFDYGKKRGWVAGNRIFISFENKTYSFKFADGIDKLEFHQVENFDSVIYYDGLAINLPTDSFGDGKLIYKCNAALLLGRPYEYCLTDGVNLLTQYEFGGDYRQFSTGGGFGLSWKKILINKVGDKNVVFEGEMNGSFIDISEDFIAKESSAIYESLLKYGLVEDLAVDTTGDVEKVTAKLKPISLKMRELVKSKKYLDKLKNEAANLVNEKKWDEIVRSFKVEKN